MFSSIFDVKNDVFGHTYSEGRFFNILVKITFSIIRSNL